jgi:hypothetical protein
MSWDLSGLMRLVDGFLLLWFGGASCTVCVAAVPPIDGPALASPSLQTKLKRYLNKRVLVFRERPLYGQGVRVAGFAQSEREPRTQGDTKAILFTDLRLENDTLNIMGEAVQPKPGKSRPVFQRHAKRFQLVTCRILLDAAAPKLTMYQALALLTRVFLTREELQQQFAKLGREQESRIRP